MDISDVRVKLIQDSSDRLKAVCTVTFDECFVIRDVKVVEGTNGLFVAMPSRKVASHCPTCRQKNQLRATYCNFCGKKLPPPRPQPEGDGRSRMHKDLAHPITSEFREVVQTRVIAAFESELEQAPEPTKESARPPKEQRLRDDPSPTRTTETTDADEMRKIEPLAVSEYDALIADLQKSSGSSHDRGTRKDAPRPREDRDEHRERAPEPAAVAPEAPEDEHPPVEPRDETRHRQPVDSTKTAAVTEPEVPAAEPEDDDSAGFGEGIL